MGDETRRSFIKRILQGGTTLGLAGIAGCTKSYDSTEQGGGPKIVEYREVAENPEDHLYADTGTDLKIEGEVELTGLEDGVVYIKIDENGEPLTSPRKTKVTAYQVEDYSCDAPGNLDFIEEYPLSSQLSDAGASEGCVDINIPAAAIEVYESEPRWIGDSYESKGYALYVR